MATVDKKRYNKMETALQYINKNFVTVSDEDAKKTNPILKQVVSITYRIFLLNQNAQHSQFIFINIVNDNN